MHNICINLYTDMCNAYIIMWYIVYLIVEILTLINIDTTFEELKYVYYEDYNGIISTEKGLYLSIDTYIT